MEQFNIIRNRIHFYNKVLVAATYTLPAPALLRPLSSSDPTGVVQNLIYSALARVIEIQPLLGVVVRDEDSNAPQWRRVKNVQLDEMVTFVDGSSDAWIEEGHRNVLDRRDELPLWRVIAAVPNPDVSAQNGTCSFTIGFYFHHGIGDGLSGGAFQLAFLDALKDLVNRPNLISSNSEVPVSKLPLPPTLEESTPLPITIWFAMKQMVRAYIYCPIDNNEWAGPPITSTAPEHIPLSSTQYFSLQPEVVAKLVATCRAKKTTVTALLTVLTARKLAQMYPNYTRFKGTVPFSMRKFSGYSNRDMGCLVTNVVACFSSEVKPPRGYISCRCTNQMQDIGDKFGDVKGNQLAKDDTLWSSTQAVKSFITTGAATPANQMAGMLAYVSNVAKMLFKKLGSKRDHAFEVTNIGVIDGGAVSEGKVFFDKIMFSGSVCTYGNPFAVAVASAKNGWMTIAVRYEEGLLSRSEASDLATYLEERLRELDV
jgi:hypothetical protein